MNCDICGVKGELFNIEMDGARFIACNNCSVYGKKISKVKIFDEKAKVKKQKVPIKKEEAEEPITIVVENYNSLIKNKREKLNMKQEELAKSINEKESLIQQIESKKIEPTAKLAEKLEKKLGITLLENYKPPIISEKSSKESGPVTLGDMIQIKTRKKK